MNAKTCGILMRQTDMLNKYNNMALLVAQTHNAHCRAVASGWFGEK